MPVIEPSSLAALQATPEGIRNVCVLAHVDHGKTSLTDSLIATNGIISPKLAGKIRYLDSRPDEQVRGITMESSAISLYFSTIRKPNQAGDEAKKQEYLINLIDSPGHVDFSSEVSTASRLCDGAVVLVDAVEGVCSQTITVLRQVWTEQMKPILVINKMDRLITELAMSPAEANAHLSKLLEQVNAVVGSFFQGERMENDLKWREKLEARLAQGSTNKNKEADAGSYTSQNAVSEDAKGPDDTLDWEESGDEDIYFEPEKGNVVFCSALDGWAFTTKQFAGIYEKKLGIKRALLEKVLWGDFYLDPKTKRVLTSKQLKGRSLKPIFVQLVLENIWALYAAISGGESRRTDVGKVEKMASSLAITLPSHILRSRDSKSILFALFNSWIPLSTAVLISIIEQLPSPKTAQEHRMPLILDKSPGSQMIAQEVRDAVCNMEKSRFGPLVAFISKMISVPAANLKGKTGHSATTLTADEARELGRKKRAEAARAQAAVNGESPDIAELRQALSESTTNEDQPNDASEESEHLIGFARLFSGTLRIGDEVYVLTPKFSPADLSGSVEPQKATVTALYLMMGRELEPLTEVPPGVVFGIGGLQGHVMKSATLCSQIKGSANLAGVNMGSQPIVRVALEPENPLDLNKLVSGLKILQQSDPCATYEMLENGEHVILTAGELHLERCLKDLTERFAKCAIQMGAPIVPYRESIVNAPEMNAKRDKALPRGTVECEITSGQIKLRLNVKPLPNVVTEFLLQNAASITSFHANITSVQETESATEGSPGSHDSNSDGLIHVNHAVNLSDKSETLDNLAQGLEKIFSDVSIAHDPLEGMSQRILSFGPRRVGPNLLIDATSHDLHRRICTLASETNEDRLPDVVNKVIQAFQLATAHGPLCQEPLQGVAVLLEDISIADAGTLGSTQSGKFTGEILKSVREAIRTGFLDWSPRLMMAMYNCEIQASAEVLGRVYGVITRRKGNILSEAMNEGTPFFTIVATIPVAESFGFSEEIRKRTSGGASPQLVFSGFDMLDVDPFWVPFTEEELEDLGELADKENQAKKYMDAVRKRKGLAIQGQKLVQNAEKQKTLKR